MTKSLLLSLFISLFISHAAFGSSQSLKKIKDDLNSKSSEIVKLGAQIKSLETSLNKNNDIYLKRLEQLKSYEAKVEKLMGDLKIGQEEINNEKAQLKRIAQTYIMEKNDEQDDNSLISQVLLEKSITKKLAKLEEMNKENSSLVEVISQYSKELASIKEQEDTLYELIVSLENQKKEVSQNYISNLETKNTLEEKLENALAQTRAKRSTIKPTGLNLDIDFDIILPIKKFSDYKGGKEGVTFKYDSVEPLIACANGSVEYAGELASYGNVIILKHGKDIRSVILGEISSKVKKGQAVRQGEIIGYTIAKPGIKKSLYYEIRKKNKVQNTLSWLKRKNNKIL